MNKLLKYLLLLSCLIIFPIKLPEWHSSYVRNATSAKVVKVLNKAMNSGGTGSHITTPKGNVYILTNAHVCEHTQENGIVIVQNEEGITIPRRVIEISNFTDLCLVEPMPNMSGLTLGSEPEIGDIVAVIGHPRLMPTTMSRGEIIGLMQVELIDHEMTEGAKCDLPKNKIEKIPGWFGIEIEVCLVSIIAYSSNAIILPGNSGSPVVNFYGHVIGVAFAGSSESNWGMFITLKDIKQFLKAY